MSRKSAKSNDEGKRTAVNNASKNSLQQQPPSGRPEEPPSQPSAQQQVATQPITREVSVNAIMSF